MDLSTPKVMGILNVTPDSFYAQSRTTAEGQIEARIEQILAEGASIIDIGAYSSRPGADDVPEEEEKRRLRKGLEIIRKTHPEAVVSVDTFRAGVAKWCVEEYGVQIINDISGGELDPQMFPTVAGLGVPYILMHMKGTPKDMQESPSYGSLLKEMFLYFARKVDELRNLGAKDLIIDPGFGFGKTQAHNYEILAHLEEFGIFGLPVLAGISRKSMIYNPLHTTPQEALNGTTALHAVALLKGARLLRVHDVKEAVETVRLIGLVKQQESYT